MMTLPTFTSGMYSISRFTVSIGSGSGLIATSGDGTGRGADLTGAAGGSGGGAGAASGVAAIVLGAAGVEVAAGVGVPNEGSRGAALGAATGGVGDDTILLPSVLLPSVRLSDAESWAPGVSAGGALIGAGGADGVVRISDPVLVGPGGRAGPAT